MNNKDLERRMRNLKKELRVQKRKLRLALQDMEKTAGFYRKELEKFKARQTKWIEEQKIHLKKNRVIKYVFADDIKKIQLRKAGRGGGIKIWTKEGDEAVFTDVDVVLPDNYVESLVFAFCFCFLFVLHCFALFFVNVLVCLLRYAFGFAFCFYVFVLHWFFFMCLFVC